MPIDKNSRVGKLEHKMLVAFAQKGDAKARTILLSECESEEDKAKLYRKWKVDTSNLDELGDPQLA
ncbi:MAG TPA: hypothetical protein VMQ44_00410 [Candidatus Saccharimonadales bacterium]|nr:hypothetical protein [Candidatus Saccharimonadales bacterium]